MRKKIIGAILSIAICELAGGVGAIFTTPNVVGWYAELVKAPLNPPAFVFGPVWTTLFALMGIAAFLVWEKRKDREVKTALAVFVLQLVLNVLWSVLFFGAHSPAAAFIDIIALWLAIIWTIIAFWKVTRLAAWLIIPYILWVTFAAYLNYSVMILN
jgi:Tryptophan-rich sensory protein (mitochondrial benzodiazepine receptor homolog)